MNKLMLITTSLLTGAALVLGGGAVAANAATATPTAPAPTPTASSCTFGEHLVSAFRGLPKAMRDDLKAARSEKPGYNRLGSFRETVPLADADGHDTLWETVLYPPDEMTALKADLKTLHSAKGKSAKLAEANTIADKALAGDYGTKIETLAKNVKASSAWQDCTPAVTGS